MGSIATMFGGAALIGILVSSWGYIKSWAFAIYSFFIVTIHANDSDFTNAVTSYLAKDFKRSRFNINETLFFCFEYVIPLKNRRQILCRGLMDEATTYWKGWRPLKACCKYNKDKNDYETVISYFRLFFNRDELLKNIEEHYNNINRNTQNRFYVERFTGNLGMYSKMGGHGEPGIVGRTAPENHVARSYIFWNLEDVGEPTKQSPIDAMALNDDCLSAIEDVKRWLKSEDWFKERGIPWKRGWNIFGKPGNGKSSLVRAIAQEINVPIMSFDLSTMTNRDFSQAWDDAISHAPCIILFEDIDGVFDGRKNCSDADGALSFDCLLNHLDGVKVNDGVLTIITTNHLEKVDEAIGKPTETGISTRPGRIDRVFEMTNPDEKGRRKIASRILKDYPQLIEQIVADGNNDTGAQFQERCRNIALEKYWENKV